MHRLAPGGNREGDVGLILSSIFREIVLTVVVIVISLEEGCSLDFICSALC